MLLYWGDINEGDILLKKIGTVDNLANIMIKLMSGVQF